MRYRALLAFAAVAGTVAAWRVTQRPMVVVLGATADLAHIQSALREIDGAVRGRLDTVDLSQPYQLRVVVRAPAGQRLRDEAQYARARVDEIVMEAHARLAWSRLSAFRPRSARDSVVVTLHRALRWPIGLPGMGQEMRSRVFRSPRELGWSDHWQGSDVSVR